MGLWGVSGSRKNAEARPERVVASEKKKRGESARAGGRGAVHDRVVASAWVLGGRGRGPNLVTLTEGTSRVSRGARNWVYLSHARASRRPRRGSGSATIFLQLAAPAPRRWRCAGGSGVWTLHVIYTVCPFSVFSVHTLHYHFWILSSAAHSKQRVTLDRIVRVFAKTFVLRLFCSGCSFVFRDCVLVAHDL